MSDATPWNPAITATCPCERRSFSKAGSICSMRAEPCMPLVRIGICQPSQERAPMPLADRATAKRPAVTCSPAATTTSYSRASWSGARSRVQAMSLLVSPAMAETTTATWAPRSTSRFTRPATWRMRSRSATEVPPNFITIFAIPACALSTAANLIKATVGGLNGQSGPRRGCRAHRGIPMRGLADLSCAMLQPSQMAAPCRKSLRPPPIPPK